MGWAPFWAISSRARLITLEMDPFLSICLSEAVKKLPAKMGKRSAVKRQLQSCSFFDREQIDQKAKYKGFFSYFFKLQTPAGFDLKTQSRRRRYH
jgi:hypothetical protein